MPDQSMITKSQAEFKAAWIAAMGDPVLADLIIEYFMANPQGGTPPGGPPTPGPH